MIAIRENLTIETESRPLNGQAARADDQSDSSLPLAVLATSDSKHVEAERECRRASMLLCVAIVCNGDTRSRQISTVARCIEPIS
jgi:hypothetical protein